MCQVAHHLGPRAHEPCPSYRGDRLSAVGVMHESSVHAGVLSAVVERRVLVKCSVFVGVDVSAAAFRERLSTLPIFMTEDTEALAAVPLAPTHGRSINTTIQAGENVLVPCRPCPLYHI